VAGKGWPVTLTVTVSRRGGAPLVVERKGRSTMVVTVDDGGRPATVDDGGIGVGSARVVAVVGQSRWRSPATVAVDDGAVGSATVAVDDGAVGSATVALRAVATAEVGRRGAVRSATSASVVAVGS
jgi:hypothetical protein